MKRIVFHVQCEERYYAAVFTGSADFVPPGPPYRENLSLRWKQDRAEFAGVGSRGSKNWKKPVLGMTSEYLWGRRDVVESVLPSWATTYLELLPFQLDAAEWLLFDLYRNIATLLLDKSVVIRVNPREKATGHQLRDVLHAAIQFEPRFNELPFVIDRTYRNSVYCGPAFKAKVEAAGIRSLRFTPIGEFQVQGEAALPDRTAETRQLEEEARRLDDEVAEMVRIQDARLAATKPTEPAPMPTELGAPAAALRAKLRVWRPKTPIDSDDAWLWTLRDAVETVAPGPSGCAPAGTPPAAPALDPEADLLGLIGLYGEVITQRARWRWEVQPRRGNTPRYRVVSEHDEHVLDLTDYLARQLRSRRDSTLVLTVNCIQAGNLPDAEPGQRVKLR